MVRGCSLNYVRDLSSASLLGQAVQKLPPNLKEAGSLHTVRRKVDRPTFIDWNEWLKDKAEAPKVRVTNRPTIVSPVKKIILCRGAQHSEEKHPHREQNLADDKLCFSCFNQNYTFRQCRNRAGVQKINAGVHITPSCTELSEFLPRKSLQ